MSSTTHGEPRITSCPPVTPSGHGCAGPVFCLLCAARNGSTRDWGKVFPGDRSDVVARGACTSGSAMPSPRVKAAKYGHKIDLSYRWSMTWFIFSEVMFFAPSSPPCGGCARTPCRCWAAWTMPALARIQGCLAHPGGRRHGFSGRHRRAVPDDDAVLAATINTACC